MKRLILTTSDSAAGAIGAARFADFRITLGRRLVWGPLPSDAQLDAFFAAQTTQEDSLYWQYHTPAWRIEKSGGKDLGLIEFCARYDSVELWIDPDPNAQLNLIWLLDYLRAHEQLASKMKFVQADFTIGNERSAERSIIGKQVNYWTVWHIAPRQPLPASMRAFYHGIA
jgi:hypothetical protein